MKIKIMSYNTQHCLNYKTQKIDFDIIAAINSFARVINLKTKLLVNPILL